MSVKQAKRRYFQVLIPAMIVFLGASMGLKWLDLNTDASDMLLAALGVIPVLALLSMFWLQWRFIQEIDEFLRQIHVQGIIIGAAVALGAGTAWGYLEMLADAPPVSMYWLNPLFWVAYSVATSILSAREGGGAI